MDELEFRDHGRRGKWIIIVGRGPRPGRRGGRLLPPHPGPAAGRDAGAADGRRGRRHARDPGPQADRDRRRGPPQRAPGRDERGRVHRPWTRSSAGSAASRSRRASSSRRTCSPRRPPAASSRSSGPDASIAPDSPNLRAVSLNVPDDRAVGGLIEPGQTVDVFITVTVNVPAGRRRGGPALHGQVDQADLPGRARPGQVRDLLHHPGDRGDGRGDQPPAGFGRRRRSAWRSGLPRTRGRSTPPASARPRTGSSTSTTSRSPRPTRAGAPSRRRRSTPLRSSSGRPARFPPRAPGSPAPLTRRASRAARPVPRAGRPFVRRRSASLPRGPCLPRGQRRRQGDRDPRLGRHGAAVGLQHARRARAQPFHEVRLGRDAPLRVRCRQSRVRAAAPAGTPVRRRPATPRRTARPGRPRRA